MQTGEIWVAITDRELPSDKLGKERTRSSKVIVFAMILIAILMLGAIAGLMVQTVNNKEPLPPETPVRTPAGIAYTVRSPISISGNAGFTAAIGVSGVSGGTGAASDPYIISDWDINASTAMIGISINDTDAHFIVKNCYVHESRSGYPSYPGGINLHNCTNGTLENNICSNKNHAGIKLESSSNNTVSNNSCSGNDFEGIWLDDSGNNTLSSNTCRGNMYGILLIDSRNNMLINNTCSGWNGIKFDSSNNNTVSNNNCSNSYQGIYLDSSNNNTLNNNICVSNSQSGVQLEASHYNHLVNNSCLHNTYGIQLIASSCNTLDNNNCSNNDCGINFTTSKIPPDPSGDNEVVNNTCSSNNHNGIYVSFSDRNDLINNTCSSNNENGIVVIMASNIDLRNNTCSNNGCGLYFGSGFNHLVQSNWFINNTGWGIYPICATPGSVTMIWNNTFIGNNGAGETYDSGHAQALSQGGFTWNSTDGYGNYWSDWTGPDLNKDGIVDAPYVLDGGADDNYPRTSTPSEPIPEFGMIPLVVIVFLAAIVLTIGARRRKGQ
jgi:parallel beta-helix repeat protein